MNKHQSIIHYRLAIAVFQKWLETGILSEEEFTKLEALLADKYCFPKGSIYR